MAYEPIDPAKAHCRLKPKYTAHKQSGGGKSGSGTANAPKKNNMAGIRPRRKSYGPF